MEKEKNIQLPPPILEKLKIISKIKAGTWKSAIIEDLPDNLYFAEGFLSKHMLDVFLRSPARFLGALDGSIPPPEPTPALIFGKAFHCYVLQPDEFPKQYAVVPATLDRRTKAGKEQWQEIIESGKTPLTEKDFEKIREMNAAIEKHDFAKMLCFGKSGKSEVAIFKSERGKYPPMKGKVDRLVTVSEKEYILVDLKTCDDSRPETFAKSCVNYRYDVQAAYYMDLLGTAIFDEKEIIPQVNFLFVCVETSAPYDVRVYSLNDEFLIAAQTILRRDFNAFFEAREQGFEMPKTLEILEPPKWHVAQAEKLF